MQKIYLPFLLPGVLQRASGFFHFTKRRKPKCILPIHLPSAAWKRSWNSHRDTVSKAEEQRENRINTRKRIAVADSAPLSGEKRLCRFRLSGAGHPAGMQRRSSGGSRSIHVQWGDTYTIQTTASKNIQRKARWWMVALTEQRASKNFQNWKS